MFKKERGITLVALVVTIVVLLILAGVSLSLVLGNQGILNHAQAAKINYTNGQNSEAESLVNVTNETNEILHNLGL